MAGGEGSSRRRTTNSAPAAATGPQAEDPAAAAAAGGQRYRYRLSKEYVRCILAMKPMEPPARIAALKRSSPELTPLPGEEADEEKKGRYILAKAFFETEENLPRMQEWMRGELREKGYVELEGERAKHRLAVDALIDREWPAIQAKIDALVLQDKENGFGDDESESDDESDEGEEDEVYY